MPEWLAMLNRLVILCDSLGMPRPDEGVAYEDTYAALLNRDSNIEVMSRGKRANDTKIQTQFQNLLDDVTFLKADYYIIQLGIVDCAPRLFTRNEARILGIIPSFIRKTITQTASKHRAAITKFRNKTYVNITDFEANYHKLIDKIGAMKKQIIVLSIYNTNAENDKRSYGFQNNIDKYNQIIQKIAHQYQLPLVNINDFEGGLLSDGIHINGGAHEFISKEISQIISSHAQ